MEIEFAKKRESRFVTHAGWHTGIVQQQHQQQFFKYYCHRIAATASQHSRRLFVTTDIHICQYNYLHLHIFSPFFIILYLDYNKKRMEEIEKLIRGVDPDARLPTR